MKFIAEIILVVALILSIGVPFGIYQTGAKTQKRFKHAFVANAIAFFSLLTVFAAYNLGTMVPAFAATGAADGGLATGLGYLGAALVTGLAGIGAGIGVSGSASAALGAISEDPSLFGKSMIFVVLAEGIALYGLVITFLILGRL